MISWYFRRFRRVSTSKVRILAPERLALEDRLNPTPNLVAGTPFANPVTDPNGLSWAIAVGDITGDGVQDFVSDAGFGHDKITVFQGTGSETFTAKTTIDLTAVGVQTDSVVLGDFTNTAGKAPDGKDDIAFISPTLNTVVVLPSKGNGTFGTPISTKTSFTRISAAAGDLNNDGIADLVLGRFGGGGPDGTAGEYEVLIGLGNGKFAAQPRLATDFSAGLDWIQRQPTLVDINGDGNLDMVANNLFAVNGAGRGGVYFGNGKGVFTSGAALITPINDGLNHHVVGDFDGDGLLDVALVESNPGSTTVYVYYQTSKGVFPSFPQTTFTTDFSTRDVTAADFDFDGCADIAFTPFSAIDFTVRIFEGSPTQTFTSGSGFAVATAGNNSPIAIIDGDANGTPDLLVGTFTNTGTTGKFQYFDNAAVPTGPISSKVKATALPNPVQYGDKVTFTASVSRFGNVPTGDVTFFANGTNIGTSTLNASGQATLVTAGAPFDVGLVAVEAKYTGDAQYLPASAQTSFTVNPLPAVLDLQFTSIIPPVPPNTNGISVFGADVTLNATLTKVGTFVPTGSFEFYANTTLLGTVAVDTAGKAKLVTTQIPVGTNIALSTKYISDPIYATNSFTATSLLDVIILPTQTDIVTSANPSVFGQPLTYTVQIFPDPLFAPVVNPTFAGQVVISDNDNIISVLNVDATGKAVFTAPPDYAIGKHTIFAAYAGTTNLGASKSITFDQVVNKANSQTLLTADNTTVSFGDAVTITATVGIVAPGIGSPTGTVTFFQDGAPISVLPVDGSGNAFITIPGLAVGDYVFTAKFSGNTSVASSISTPLDVTIIPTTSSTTFTVTPANSSLGTPIELKALVIDGNNNPAQVGFVTFSGTFNGNPITPVIADVIDGFAIAVLPGTTFLFGSGEFFANYTGTESISDSAAGPIAFTVDKAVPGVFLTSTLATAQPIGTTIPLTVNIVPPVGVALPITGTVQFFDNGTLFATVPVVNGAAAASRQPTLGIHSFTATYSGDSNYEPVGPVELAFNIFRPTDRISAGVGNGGSDRVNVYDSKGNLIFSPNLFGFTPDYTSGVRVATADFNGDGVQDIAAATGPGTGSRVRILSGKDGSPLADFSPFGLDFTGGVFLAAGDINGDLRPDLVVTPDKRGGARVRVYDNAVLTINNPNPASIADFIGIIDAQGNADVNFRGGARPAVGDVNGDGFADVVVAAGVGGGPRIAVFSGKGIANPARPKLGGDFLAFEANLRNGSFVAVGDINGDGFADIIAGAGPGGGPRVSIFSGAAYVTGSVTRIADFFAGDVNSRGGVPVASRFLDNDDRLDLVTGTGGSTDRITAYLGANLVGATVAPPTFLSFNAFTNATDPLDATRGVFVG